MSPSAYDVPDGEYEVIVDEVELTDVPALVWHLRIASGPYVGRELRTFRTISELTRGRIKDDFTKCGVELETICRVPGGLDQLSGLRVPVVKRTLEGSVLSVHLQWRAETDRR